MSLLSKVKKGLKKGFKALSTVNPALGLGLSDINKAQGMALLQAGGLGSVPGMPSLPGGANPLASLLGGLGTKVGIPSAIGTTLASSFLPGLPQLPTVDEARSYAAWKIAPDSLLANLNFDPLTGKLKKRRRMNPLNAKAAKRAIRRIKAVRKITAGIERALPKVRQQWRGHWHGGGGHYHRR